MYNFYVYKHRECPLKQTVLNLQNSKWKQDARLMRATTKMVKTQYSVGLGLD